MQFQAPHGEIARAEFEVVEAERFEPFSVVPKGVGGQKQGSFPFGLHSGVPQQVTLRATLIDSAGRRSSPVSFSFEVRKAPRGRIGPSRSTRRRDSSSRFPGEAV